MGFRLQISPEYFTARVSQITCSKFKPVNSAPVEGKLLLEAESTGAGQCGKVRES